ncbi:otospiralin-like [Hyla sarda]|uniref:otospiralin-like n=1 Tax=Hyla sarda TaxID=327740 RepID=UPI0024C3BC65|nr:otospiralin-like [Hyla sarda]
MSPSKVLLLTIICLVYLATFSSPAVLRNRAVVREKRAMPNWSMSSSDFYGWVDELRRLAAYDKTNEMARIYWAHFPIASYLGYEDPDAEE